jgi:sporulation protein YqfC
MPGAKSKKGKSNNRGASLLARMLEMPENAMPGGVMHIEFTSNREAVIDGCQGIVEYEPHRVRLLAGQVEVTFVGRQLQLKCLTLDSAVVQGHITSVEFSE